MSWKVLPAFFFFLFFEFWLGVVPETLKKSQVRLVSVKAERPNHPSRSHASQGEGSASQGGGPSMMTQTPLHKAACFVALNLGGGVSQLGGGGSSTTTMTTTHTWLHQADSTYSRARPKNTVQSETFPLTWKSYVSPSWFFAFSILFPLPGNVFFSGLLTAILWFKFSFRTHWDATLWANGRPKCIPKNVAFTYLYILRSLPLAYYENHWTHSVFLFFIFWHKNV